MALYAVTTKFKVEADSMEAALAYCKDQTEKTKDQHQNIQVIDGSWLITKDEK